jgi:microtubule-associated protein-like 6
VRLFKYPVIIPKQKSKEYVGQSSHVTKVRFSPDESFLLSIGGNDRTTILWELKGVKKAEK